MGTDRQEPMSQPSAAAGERDASPNKSLSVRLDPTTHQQIAALMARFPGVGRALVVRSALDLGLKQLEADGFELRPRMGGVEVVPLPPTE